MTVQSSPTLPPYFNELHIGIALHHPQSGALLDANTRLESMYGYPTAQLRSMDVETYSANTYAYSEELLVSRIRSAADGDDQSFRWRVKCGDGELIWVQIRLSRSTVENRDCVIAEIRDITEYTATNRRLSLLSRVIRHNLRNDVTVINGFAEMIRKQTTDPEIEAFARRIEDNGDAIGGLAQSVKEIDQATNQTGTAGQDRPARAVVADVATTLGAQFPAATIDVIEETEMWVSEQQALADALRHAIENAIVHAADDAPTIRVVVDESPNTGRVEIQIADNAPPIPQIEIDAIDESSENTPTSHGSGVGLFVMKWCIESLGGELKVDRAETRGNVVYFYLPPKPPTTE